MAYAVLCSYCADEDLPTGANVGPHIASSPNYLYATYNGVADKEVAVSRYGNTLLYATYESGLRGHLSSVALTFITVLLSKTTSDFPTLYYNYAGITGVTEWLLDDSVTQARAIQSCLDVLTNPEPEPYQGVVVEVIGVPNDPMDDGGTSGSRDPTGDFDDETDRIPEPALPTISAQGSGMITLFRPTLEQVHDLGEYLWTHLSDFIENLQKLFTNPMSYIVAFHIVPCIPSVFDERAVNIGNFITSITMPPCVSQWYTYDFGNITIAPYSGTYLDYSPYTKIQLFLPFIGTVTLNTDEVMGTNVGVKYRIDLLSGHFAALISVNNSYIYQYTGECSIPIPLSGSDWSRVYSAAVSAVGTAITGGVSALSGGVGPMQVGMASAASRSLEAAATAGTAFSGIEKVKGAPAMRDRMAQVADLAIENAKTASQKSGLVTRSVKASKVASTIAGTVNAVMGAKQYVSHSGSVTGPAGILGNKKPFVLIEYPNQSLAQNYKHFVGYPSNISGKVKEFTGYTECEQVVPDSFSGTDEELAQVLELLKEGVYL